MIGRRGPAQAAFTNPEIKELGQLEDTAVFVPLDEAELDPLSQADLDQRRDQTDIRKVELIQEYAGLPRAGKARQIILRFLVTPEEILSDGDGRVTGIRMVRNTLTQTEAGTLRPQATDQTEEIPVGLVFHAIGYRGVSLPGIPFNERWGVIPNQNGRILNLDGNQPISGLYTAGWIKRGPSGVIGTNKSDASDTVQCMLADLEQGIALTPPAPTAAAAEEMIRQRQPEYILFDDWLHLDEIEVARGEETDRPRVKFTVIEEMLQAVDY